MCTSTKSNQHIHFFIDFTSGRGGRRTNDGNQISMENFKTFRLQQGLPS
jgi:hypothetical protein